MRKITKKDKRRFLIWSMLIFIIICYLGVFSFNYWSQILSNRKETLELEKKYNQLLEEEQALNEEINKLQDPEYVAKYAREKYSYSKDNELIIKVPE